MYSQDWHLHLNRIWGVTWTMQRWSQSLMNVWQSKGGEKNRMFVIRVMIGLLPTGEKIAARHIGDGRCLGCQHPKETLKHIFWECPIIKNLLRQVSLWFHNRFQVPFFIRDLVLGPRTLRQKQILDCVVAVRGVVLWKIWLHRNERIFQGTPTLPNVNEVILECKYVSSLVIPNNTKHN